MSNAWAIMRQDWRILQRDPITIVLLIVMPLGTMFFFTPIAKLALERQGYSAATGAEQVVPGFATMFGFLTVSVVAFAVIREHGWGTWDRLRATPATARELVLGKLGVPMIVAVAQSAAIFLVGGTVLGLRIRGSVAAVALVAVAFCLWLVALGMAVAAISRSAQQVGVISNLLMVFLGFLGGSLVPLTLLPSWAQSIAPLTPTYWAMLAYRHAILDGGGVASVLPAVGVLLLFATASAVAAAARFRVDEEKVGFS